MARCRIKRPFKFLFVMIAFVTVISCCLFVYLATSVLQFQNSQMSATYKKLPNYRKHYFANYTKLYRSLNLKELFQMKIEKKIDVNASKILPCNEEFSMTQVAKVHQEIFKWQTVTPGDENCYLFSAFRESRTDPPVVKIIGITTNSFVSKNKYCQLWSANSTTPDIVEAKFFVLPESHEMKYSVTLITCFLVHLAKFPFAVSLVNEPCQEAKNILKIENNHQSVHSQYTVNFTVCVTPLNMHFDGVDQFVEIIETNRIFGAEHFVFYNHTVGKNVEKYLKNYWADGIVTVIPWNIPVAVNMWPPDPGIIPEIHYFGQVAALNDCFYRNMFRSRFFVFTDLDELIVPRVHDTWLAMLMESTDDWHKTFFSINNKEMFPGSYLIQNVFFRLEWEDVVTNRSNIKSHDKKLLVLKKLTREKMIYPHYLRSKYITWSKMAAAVGIHGVYEYIDDSRVISVRVKKEHALLHHYRVWDGEGNVSSVRNVRDERMLHFSKEIARNVEQRHQNMNSSRQ